MSGKTFESYHSDFSARKSSFDDDSDSYYKKRLAKVKADISADYVRLESNITRFMLSVIELPKITAGPQEAVYLGAMLQLGLSIQWDKLTVSVLTKKGSPKQF